MEVAKILDFESCAAIEEKPRGWPQECGPHQQGRESTPNHMPILPAIPAGLTTNQQQQLQQLLLRHHIVFAQHKQDFGRTSLIQHEIHTEGPPEHVPFWRQNPYIWQEED